MKTMVIGLRPDYTYPGKLEIWSRNNTLCASNCGASLITRALLREFDADYVDDFSDIEGLKRTYDTCVIALATHITPNRDVSIFADVVEKLEMKTIAPSLGLSDYISTVSSAPKLHPSVKRLLNLVLDRSEWLGVRGHYTASVLYRNGFRKIVPIGCPSLFWRLSENLEINKPERIFKPLIVYHPNLAGECLNVLNTNVFLGQDFLDEAVFTNNLDEDRGLQATITTKYKKFENYSFILEVIRKNGVFFPSFQKWFNYIGQHDFVFGPRLHGNLAALIQGIPAALTPRDLRMNEISEMFRIPTISFDQMKTKTINELFEIMDYSDFNQTYKLRYNNYLKFLEENKVSHMLDRSDSPDNFIFTNEDIQANICIFHSSFPELKREIERLPIIQLAEMISKLVRKVLLVAKLPRQILSKLIRKMPLIEKLVRKIISK